MAEPDVEASDAERAARILSDLAAILDVDILHSDWERDLIQRRAFYVRGMAWFRHTYLKGSSGIDDAASLVSNQKAILRSRENWRRYHFNWDEPFSPNQFFRALRYQAPLKFQKAVEVLVFCEAIAARDSKLKQVDSSVIYQHMGIAPALFVVDGFNRDVMDKLQGEALSTLRHWTGQPSSEVFYDMADGKSVTFGLAEMTRGFLESYVDDIHIGDVSTADRRSKPSLSERVDVTDTNFPKRRYFFISHAFDRDEPLEIDAADFLIVRRSEEGTWLEAQAGLPVLSAFVCAASDAVTIYWPRGANESCLVHYFREVVRDTPPASVRVRFFFENEVLTEISDSDVEPAEQDEGLLPVTISDDWRSGALAVSLEVASLDESSHSKPSIIWYTSGTKKTGLTSHHEAGVQVARGMLRSHLDSLAEMIEKSHATLRHEEPPFGAKYMRRMLSAVARTLGV